MLMSLVMDEGAGGMRRDGAILAIVAICTYKRPKMLAACLESIIGQELPDNLIMHVVVIDNDELKSGHVPYIRIAGKTGIWTTYLVEPVRGISSVRNKAIDFALEQEADYLLYIDDDETAEKDWLARLMNPQYLETGILQGNRIMTSDHIPEKFRPKPVSLKHEHGALLEKAATNNMRIHSRLLKAGLRFDEDFNLSGSADADFSIAARRMNEEIRFIKTAITWEPYHIERLNLYSDFHRAKVRACSKIRIDMKYGHVSKWRSYISIAYFNFIGTYQFLIGEFLLSIWRKKGEKMQKRGMMKVANGQGIWAALNGEKLNFYEETTGE